MSSWFPVGRQDPAGWRLDVVALLAVLGDSPVTRHIQALNASRLTLLPRLIPAPHAFVKSARVNKLPGPEATVCGVHSGTLRHELNYFADLLHPIAKLKPFQVSVYEVTCKTEQMFSPDTPPAVIPTNRWSILNLLTIGSCIMTFGIFLWALLIKDGTAAVAIVTMAFSSSLLGLSMCWKPRLTQRPSKAAVPKGDVIIRTRAGAFLIVRCSEETARELYTGPEECEYQVSKATFKALAGVSTLFIMTGVVLLGNCSWFMQAVITVSYFIINACYWAASLLPHRRFWDLSRYTCKDVTPTHLRDGCRTGIRGDPPSFTRSLWYAIQATESIRWVSLSSAAPQTLAWEEWLKRAEHHCRDPNWDAVGEKDILMKPR